MRLRIHLLLMIVLGASSLVIFSQHPDFPVLKGPYFGQKPPGMTPEVFAPGIISTEATEGCSYQADHRMDRFNQWN